MPVKRRVTKKQQEALNQTDGLVQQVNADGGTTTSSNTQGTHPNVGDNDVVRDRNENQSQQQIHEHVILQLPINQNRLQDIMDNTNMHGILEYNPNIVDPQPYIPHDAFMSGHDMLLCEDASSSKKDTKNKSKNKNDLSQTSAVVNECNHDNVETDVTLPSHHGCVCYWCCHTIPHIEYGMPIRYDVFHKSFTLYGSFCSLECVAAYNFTTHMGSDRVWEIHSWIQMLAHRYGYIDNVRPAPSKYLLKMFNGPLTIEEFRDAHKGLARTYMTNIPPFIHVVSQMEVLNTSFLDMSSHGNNGAVSDSKKGKKKAVVAATPTVKSSTSIFETTEIT